MQHLIVRYRYVIFAVLGSVLMVTRPALAADNMEPKHKLVIQVSSADKETQQVALNNAVNVQQLYGIDDVAIEVVAYGPGLSILTTDSEQAARVKSLATQNIRFSACGNTMAGVKKKTGKDVVLTAGVKVVPVGLGRIIELQEQGYSYVRP